MIPALLKVWQDDVRYADCKFCQQPVEWRVTVHTGRPILLDGGLEPVKTDVSGDGRKMDFYIRDACHWNRCRRDT